MSDGEPPKQRSPGLFTALGWVTGALSLLNLIRDLTPVELYGLLQEWSDGYSMLVNRIVTTLFGWIHWRWIAIDHLEGHVLVISALLTSAAARAAYRLELQKQGSSSMFLMVFACVVIMFAPTLAILLLFPSNWGVVIGAAFNALLLLVFSFFVDPADNFMAPGDFRRELAVVGAALIVLIVINYAFLRPA